MDWKLRNHEDFPTYSLHVGGILLEIYPHGGVIDDGITDYKPEESHWQGAFWVLEPGKQPHEGPLDAVKSCKPDVGTLAQKQAEVLELAKAWLREQVDAFDALAPEADPEANDAVCFLCGKFVCLCGY